MAGRASKSILNAKVNVLFYFLSLFFSFFTRKIFLDCLGDEFVGLTGTLGSILGYLNLAELGLSSCICFFLYKPLQENDREKTQEIMSLMGYLYRKIGLFVLGAGALISLSFPFVFTETEQTSLAFVYFAFYSFMGSSLIEYFINYRQILLTADQKEYLISIYMQTSTLLKIGLQILLAYYLKNIYLWSLTEFLFGLFACIVLNIKINREYPWLKADKSKGKALLKKYPEVLTNVKQIFVHKIKDFLLGRSDELFIFIFVSLKMVAYYSNYTMIIGKVAVLFNTALNSVSASIGNLVAEGDKKKLLSVFWEMMSLRHFASGFLAFSILTLIDPFISIWLGPQYVIDQSILILLVTYFYIENTKRVIDMYNYAYGLYSDTWAAWTELTLNISIILIAGHYLGIVGILLGKIISMSCISMLWKPYFLFSQGLKTPVLTYWKGAIPLYALTVGTVAAVNRLCTILPFHPSENIWQWIAYSASSVIIYLLASSLIYYNFTKGTKDFATRMLNRFRNR